MFEEAVSLSFIFQSIAAILIVTAIAIYFINSNKRSK